MRENVVWNRDCSGQSDETVCVSLRDLIPVSEFIKNIKGIFDQVTNEGRVFVVTCHGRPVCKIVPLTLDK